MRWVVYIVRCADDSLYTGVTNDLDARIAKHNAGKGARYTRSRRPVVAVWVRRVADRSTALSLEMRIKQLDRTEKLALVAKKRRLVLRRETKRGRQVSRDTVPAGQ